MNLKRLRASNCVYIFTIIILFLRYIYVDDIILFAPSIDKINKVKLLLTSEYEIGDLGRRTY